MCFHLIKETSSLGKSLGKIFNKQLLKKNHKAKKNTNMVHFTDSLAHFLFVCNYSKVIEDKAFIFTIITVSLLDKLNVKLSRP